MKQIVTFIAVILTATALYSQGSTGLTVYTKPGCSRCDYTIKYLKTKKIPHTELSTSDRQNNVKMWAAISSAGDKSGTSVTMPVVVINGKTYFSMKDLRGFTASIPSLLAAGNGNSKVDINKPPDKNIKKEFDAPPVNRFYYVKSVQAGTQNLGYWDQPGFPKRFKKGANLALFAKDNKIDQQFRFRSAGNGFYYIESRNKGIVDVSGNKKANGTNVQIWSGHGGSNQLYRFKHLGDGRWKIYAHNGGVICTPRKFSNRTNVHLWDDHNGPWMEWYFEDALTKKNYALASKEEPVKISSTPDFMIQNKDRAFKFTSESMVSRYTGTAYIAYIDSRIAYIHTLSTGINPDTAVEETVSGILAVYYNPQTGEYSDGSNDKEFGLSGRADGNAKMLGMSHSQGGIRFEVTADHKSSVIPKDPEFFINNKTKKFEFKGQTAFAGGSSGSATVKSIKGNEVVLTLTRSYKDERTGKDVTKTSEYKLYYINGYYTNNISEYPTWGVAAGMSNKIDISGDQSSDLFIVE